MKTREEQIEEIAKCMCKERGTVLCAVCDYWGDCSIKRVAKKIYSAGYRKQSDTAREILKPLYDCIMEHSDCCVNLSEDIKFNMKKYGVEVEE